VEFSDYRVTTARVTIASVVVPGLGPSYPCQLGPFLRKIVAPSLRGKHGTLSICKTSRKACQSVVRDGQNEVVTVKKQPHIAIAVDVANDCTDGGCTVPS